MNSHRYNACRAAVVAMLVILASMQICQATPAHRLSHIGIDAAPAIRVSQATDTPPRDLEPRYQPAPPQQKSWYNDSYIFAATRGVSDSTLVPALKVSLFFLTVPLDLVALPFAAIGGLFG